MKILHISTPFLKVPPFDTRGATERQVYYLAKEQTRAGHEVTIFAPNGSRADAKVFELVRPTAGLPIKTEKKLIRAYKKKCIALIKEIGNFDIIHSHHYEAYPWWTIKLAQLKIPCITTFHNGIPYWVRPIKFFVRPNYAVLNTRMKEYLDRHHVPNVWYAAPGLDMEKVTFSKYKKDYLLSLSYVSPIKGTHVAIEIAERTGEKLIIAGRVGEGSEKYFETVIKPRLTKNIQYVGEVTEGEKDRLFADAKAHLFPTQYEEPFGLVMVEANARGTPVIALDIGKLSAVPDVIAHEKTGFVCHNIDEMIEALKKIDKIEPNACREYAEQNFSTQKFAERYEKIYREIIERKK